MPSRTSGRCRPVERSVRHRDLLGAGRCIRQLRWRPWPWGGNLKSFSTSTSWLACARGFAVGFTGTSLDTVALKGSVTVSALRRRGSLRIIVAADYGQGLLGLDAEKHLSQTERLVFLSPEQLRQMNVGLDQRPDGFAVLGFEFVGIDALERLPSLSMSNSVMVGFVCFMSDNRERQNPRRPKARAEKRAAVGTSSGEAPSHARATIAKARENGKSDSTRFVFHGSPRHCVNRPGQPIATAGLLAPLRGLPAERSTCN